MSPTSTLRGLGLGETPLRRWEAVTEMGRSQALICSIATPFFPVLLCDNLTIAEPLSTDQPTRGSVAPFPRPTWGYQDSAGDTIWVKRQQRPDQGVLHCYVS